LIIDSPMYLDYKLEIIEQESNVFVIKTDKPIKDIGLPFRITIHIENDRFTYFTDSGKEFDNSLLAIYEEVNSKIKVKYDRIRKDLKAYDRIQNRIQNIMKS